MERDATRSDDLRIAARDAAASGVVAILGIAAVLIGAGELSGVGRIGLVVVGAFVAFTGLRALGITVRQYRWKAERRAVR
jgi:hypothetical protein